MVEERLGYERSYNNGGKVVGLVGNGGRSGGYAMVMKMVMERRGLVGEEIGLWARGRMVAEAGSRQRRCYPPFFLNGGMEEERSQGLDGYLSAYALWMRGEGRLGYGGKRGGGDWLNGDASGGMVLPSVLDERKWTVKVDMGKVMMADSLPEHRVQGIAYLLDIRILLSTCAPMTGFTCSSLLAVEDDGGDIGMVRRSRVVEGSVVSFLACQDQQPTSAQNPSSAKTMLNAHPHCSAKTYGDWALGVCIGAGLVGQCRNWAYGPGETGLSGPVVETGLMGQYGNWAWWANVGIGLMGQYGNWAWWASVETGLMGQYGNWAWWANVGIGLMGQYGNWAWWASVETGLGGPIWKLGLVGQCRNWAYGPIWKLGLWANMEIGLGGPKLGLWASVNWAWWASVETELGGPVNWAYGPIWKLGLVGQCRNWAYGPIWKLGLVGQCRNWAYGPIWKLGLWANMEIGLGGPVVETGLMGQCKLGLVGQCRNWAYGPDETGLRGQHVGNAILKGDVICECQDKTRYTKNFAPVWGLGKESRDYGLMDFRAKTHGEIHQAAPRKREKFWPGQSAPV
ncbi:hypothetical protein V8G54_029278 [Vigna mungo]|uniref:Uncharacterized protein n=1 Tax=Vigna mungo TaxID=3915 RepID=A0AAQ3MTK7_VIGMU